MWISVYEIFLFIMKHNKHKLYVYDKRGFSTFKSYLNVTKKNQNFFPLIILIPSAGLLDV